MFFFFFLNELCALNKIVQSRVVEEKGGEQIQLFMAFHNNYEISKTPACPYQILIYCVDTSSMQF